MKHAIRSQIKIYPAGYRAPDRGWWTTFPVESYPHRFEIIDIHRMRLFQLDARLNEMTGWVKKR